MLYSFLDDSEENCSVQQMDVEQEIKVKTNTDLSYKLVIKLRFGSSHIVSKPSRVVHAESTSGNCSVYYGKAYFVAAVS